MYLRITKRRNKDGTEVRYYQLAENEWNAEKGLKGRGSNTWAPV